MPRSPRLRLPAHSRLASAALAFAAALLAAAPAPAQDTEGEAPPTRRVRVTGSVVDATTGLPLRDVSVRLGHTSRISPTDAEGRFDLFGVPAGSYPLVVERLGYRARAFLLEAESDTAVGQIALEPDAILLEAVRASVSHFDRRVERYPGMARVLTREQIAGSAAGSAKDVVSWRAMLMPAACGFAHTGTCFLVRGQPVQPLVYVDELPAIGGMEDLAMYHPREIERIEVYGGGRMIRVYTTWFMENAARTRYRPSPILPF